MSETRHTDSAPLELRAWQVFVVRQRNWKLWAYWLRTQASDLTKVRS